ncbi:MAG: hypothetical protein IPH49_05405 [Ignavibacteria bacterium]|nr:hypothetical protein [Ignavibacteria bacterium]
MKYVIMVMLMTGVCVGQTVVDLPSSFNLFKSNEKLACVATYTSLCSGPMAESIETCVPVPYNSVPGQPPLGIASFELDPDGRFVYVLMGSEGGLYRLDLQSSSWRFISPPNAGVNLTALHVTSSGAVIIGTGGSQSSTESQAKGMYRSTDNGDTWSHIDVRESEQSRYRGVSMIQSTANGKLLAVFRLSDSYHQQGIYMQQDTGGWKYAAEMSVPDELIVVGDHAYATRKDAGLYHVDLRQSTPKEMRILKSRFHSTIHRWTGDTLAAFLDSELDSLPPSVYLIVKGVVVDTIVLKARPVTFQKMRFATDLRSGAPSRFIAFGCGRNSIVDRQGADVGDVAPRLNMPTAGSVRSAAAWARIHVSNHGRYVIDTNGVAVLDSTIGRGLRGGFSEFNADDQGLLIVQDHELVNLQRVIRDTVVRVGYDTTLNSAVRTSRGTIIVSTRRQGLQEFTIQSSSWKPFSTEGLPQGAYGDSSGNTRIYFVFIVEGVLYAWVGNVRNTIDTITGLYAYRSTWSKVDIRLPHDAHLADADFDGQSVVLAFVGYLTYQPSGSDLIHQEPSGSVIVRLNGADGAPTVFASTLPQTLPALNAVCYGKNIAWLAYPGIVWTAPDPEADPIVVRSGTNEEIGRVGSKLLVVTRDSGVLLYDAP